MRALVQEDNSEAEPEVATDHQSVLGMAHIRMVKWSRERTQRICSRSQSGLSATTAARSTGSSWRSSETATTRDNPSAWWSTGRAPRRLYKASERTPLGSK